MPNFSPTALTDPRFCILCGERGTADFLSNIVLFAPLGAVLAVRGRRALATVVAAAGLSLFVELAQLTFVPGRDANPGDLLANTLGAACGWGVVAGLWTRLPQVSRALGGWAWAAAGLAALAVVIGGAVLFRPAIPGGALYLQWTAQFGNMTHYDGQVLTTRINGQRYPGPGRFADPRAVAAHLAGGGTLEAEVIVGSPPVGLAPIVSLFDGAQREVWLLGADGDGVALRRRTLGRLLRLDAPPLRFEAAGLAGARGQRVRLEIAADARSGCLVVGTDRSCRRGPGTGDTWTLLRGATWWDSPMGTAIGVAWMLLLFMPAGALAGERRSRAALLSACCAGLLVLPVLLGLPATRLIAVLGAGCGIGAGALLRHLRAHAARATLQDDGSARLLVGR